VVLGTVVNEVTEDGDGCGRVRAKRLLERLLLSFPRGQSSTFSREDGRGYKGSTVHSNGQEECQVSGNEARAARRQEMILEILLC
jgi:hypothetical protein